MSNVTTMFILGAGSSVEAGVPLMKDFLDSARDLMDSGGLADDEEHFRTVFQARGDLQRSHSKCAAMDLHNIESIYSTIEFANLLRWHFPSLAEEKNGEQVAFAMRRLIIRTIEERTQFWRNQQTLEFPDSYDNFVRLVAHLKNKANIKHEVVIVTFNYDIALDAVLSSTGIEPCYQLLGEPPQHNQVPLLKLHGSLNWYDSEGRVGAWDMRSLLGTVQREFSGYRTMRFPGDPEPSRKHFSFRVSTYIAAHYKAQSVIVPPTWNKAQNYEALATVWARAADALSRAENICVLGYSLPETDYFFKTLFALGTVGDQPIRRFIVVDPSEEAARRFRALLGPGAEQRFEHFAEKFTNGIEKIAGRLCEPDARWKRSLEDR